MGTTPPAGGVVVVVAPSAAGWVATRLAMERISPVLTSMTMAVPLTELDVSIACARACSDSYCTCVSSVSSSPVPGDVATWFVTGDCGSATPPGDSMIVSLPAEPASEWLSPYSMPAAPFPAALVNPITGEARLPFGTSRFESAINVMPGSESLVIVSTVACGSCRAKIT